MKNEKNNTQSRKWLITINNPYDYSLDRNTIKNKLDSMKSIVYYCVVDEIGEEGTFHTHIYIASSSAIRFSTIKKKFKQAHIDLARGTSEQNREYLRKEGKHRDKACTNLKETFEEEGEMPFERQGARSDLEDLYDMIKNGMTNHQILEQHPTFLTRLSDIDRTRLVILEEKYREVWRELEVFYVYGKSGTGKTRSVMDAYGYSNVYRVTDYKHPFDSYQNQDVLILEEFRSSLKISDLLTLLEGYPLSLSCRYSNRQACFTKVYIISNYHILDQYQEMQITNHETYAAFIRRVNHIYYFSEKNVYIEKDIASETMSDFHRIA